MPRHGKITRYAERLACASKIASEQTDAEIAQRLGWSKWTVRKWRRAYQKNGEDGLFSQMGRPRGGPLSTFPLEVRDELEKMRRLLIGIKEVDGF